MVIRFYIEISNFRRTIPNKRRRRATAFEVIAVIDLLKKLLPHTLRLTYIYILYRFVNPNNPEQISFHLYQRLLAKMYKRAHMINGVACKKDEQILFDARRPRRSI